MLTLLFALVYVQVGFQLGKKAEKTWKKGDSDTLASFLLFPVSHSRGKVGAPDMPCMSGINGGETFYRTLMTMGWPLFLAWNALVISVLGPDKIIKRLTRGPTPYEELEARLLKEEKKVDRVIRRLEAGTKPRKQRQKQPKALPAVAAEVPRLEMPEPPRVAAPTSVPAQHADPVPPPVQVRVTVDVTASGPATEETGRAEEEPRAAPEQERERVMH